MLLCMRCGEMNDPKENYCQKCGATLPKLAYTMEMASVDVVLDLYYKFADKVAQLRTGQITLDEFTEYIDYQADKQARMEEDIKNTDIHEEIMEDFEEELELGFSGIEKVNEGIDLMIRFIEEEQTPTLLDQGLELIKEGCRLINKAKNVNRERDKKWSHYAELQRSEESMEL